MRSILSLVLLAVLTGLSATQGAKGTSANPEGGAHLPSQSVADAIKEAAGTDGAFVPARSVSATYDANNLASMLQYPADDIVVVRLTGKEIRLAFERSISLFPQPNSSFLQLAGFTVEFSAAGSPDSRVLNVTAGGAPLDENRAYTVAMPGSLGRGGMGYFKIWNKSKIERTLPSATLESVLKGRRYAASSPRWVARP
jgi:2',3'-cyclic-nucleotide 2'-phosphodiesterase (5'-nucleotidase family)